MNKILTTAICIMIGAGGAVAATLTQKDRATQTNEYMWQPFEEPRLIASKESPHDVSKKLDIILQKLRKDPQVQQWLHKVTQQKARIAE